MPMVRYRKALIADAPALSRLHGEDESCGADEYLMARYMAGEHHPEMALHSRTVLVATANDAPIGYIAGHLTLRFGCHGEIQWIYVAREHRDGHVAKQLLRLQSRWFVQHRAFRVCADVCDDRARRLYRHHGADDYVGHWVIWDNIGVSFGHNSGLSRAVTLQPSSS